MAEPAQNPLVASVAAALASGQQVEALAEIKEVAAYCRAQENGRVLQDYDLAGALELLIAYHMAKGTITIMRDPLSGQIAGVHMWYRCYADIDWQWVKSWQPDELQGDAIFMAFLYASEPWAMAEMVHDLIRKEPDVLVKKLITSRLRADGQRRIDRDVRYLHKILKVNERKNHGR